MKLLNFNIIYLTFFSIIGIVLQNQLNISLNTTILIGAGLFILFLVLSLFKIAGRLQNVLYLITIAALFMSIGFFTVSSRSAQHALNHYSNSSFSELSELLIKVEKRIKPSTYHQKYYAELIELNGHKVTGRILLNHAKDSASKQLKVDDIIIAKAELHTIQEPLNPHQFNYRNYLKNHYVYHQVYIDYINSRGLQSKPSSVYGYADRLRLNINSKLHEAGFNSTSVQMINALLLGQKQDIDPDIYNSYINAGTVHILAVSGLHVGIILWILTMLFKPLLHLKHGRVIRGSLIVILLWLFAFVAGLSPSVTRAVTMFSILSIAMHLKRETNIYNTLATSAFILLLVNPNLLFEVGFQLSYSAVLSIVAFQPLICNIWTPKHRFVSYIWQIFGVTLAAQLGVAPLSLFYFHQFPGLFFISNLVVVPVLGIILGFGLIVILLSLFNLIPAFVVNLFEEVISSLNRFIAWVSQFESFMLKDIPFDFTQLLICSLFVISVFWTFKTRQFRWTVLSLATIIVFQSYLLCIHSKSHPDKFVIFNKSRHSIIGEQKEYTLVLSHNLKDSIMINQKFIKNYVVGERIIDYQSKSMEPVYKIKDQTILRVDSSAVYQNLTFKPDIVALQFSPKLNLERLLENIQPQVVAADASNFKSYVQRWKETCKKYNTNFHYTAEDGAFILSE